MQPNYIGEILALKQDIQSTTKEHFYSNAIKYQVQLLWFQGPLEKLYLFIIAIACLSFVGAPVVAVVLGYHVASPSNNDSLVVAVTIGSMIAGITIAGMYATGLLIYGWRIKRAYRRKMTVIYQSEITLTPVEVAALVGSANYVNEGWGIVYRLIETGNLKLTRELQSGKWLLHRRDDIQAFEQLHWYEQEVLLEYFPTGEKRMQLARKILSPERFQALKLNTETQPVYLDRCGLLISDYPMRELNKRVRAHLISQGVFRPLTTIGLWLQTWLMVLTFFMGTCVLFMFALAIDQYVRDGLPGALGILSMVDTAIDAAPGIIAGLTIYDVAYLGLLTSLLVGPMLWFFSTDIYTRFGLTKYIEARGLALYLEVALKDRLVSGGLSDLELLRYLPYAEVLGVVDVDADALSARAISMSQAAGRTY